MLSALSLLANRGEIDRLSVQFSQFIQSQSESGDSPLTLAVAALVSDQSLQGHVCIKLNALTGQGWLVDLLRSEAPQYLPIIAHTNHCKTELLCSPMVGLASERTPLVIDRERLYLNRFWLYETAVTRQILRRCQSRVDVDTGQLNNILEALFPAREDEDQRNAARKAAMFGFSVISGGPGTGKTTTIVKILSLLMTLKPDMRIALAAPTGKAAARMMASMQSSLQSVGAANQSLPDEAFTIHRLLGLRQGKFEFHQDHRLPFDCVVVDEASMIDMALAHRLLDACDEACRVILLGDRDQLASVAAGNVLGDITGHGLPLHVNKSNLRESIALLNHSRRFSEDSGIAALAKQINNGATANTLTLLRSQAKGITGIFDHSDQPANALLEQIIESYAAIVAADTNDQALQLFDQFRVLTASNHGSCGVDQLNHYINSRLRQRAAISRGEIYQGQTIMVTQNDRNTRLFNGDTGVIWHQDGLWFACFRDQQQGIRQIAVNRLPAFTSAWATTVHKSQGSEFATVLLFMPGDIEPRLLCRELLYTAVTRSTEHFILQSTEDAICRAVSNVTSRSSGLALKLGWPETPEDPV